MRLYLLSFLVFLIGISALFAQAPYNRFAVDHTHWGVIFKPPVTIPPYEDIFEFNTRGDTTIGAYTYQKVYYQDMRSKNLDWDPPWVRVGSPQLVAFIRDDTAARQVFAIYLDTARLMSLCPQGKEFLLYDFSVEMGDSVIWCGQAATQDTGIVLSTYYDQTGGYQGLPDSLKVISVHDFTNTEVLGPLEGTFIGIDGQNYYQSYYYCKEPDVWNCSFLTSLNKPVSLFDLEIAPNPSRDRLTLTWQSKGFDFPSHIVLQDLHGKPILNTPWTPGREVLDVDVQAYSEGVYALGVYQGPQLLGYRKVVVMR